MPVAEKMKEIPGVYLTSFCHMIHTQASHRHFIKYPFHMIHGHSRTDWRPYQCWKWAKNDRLWTTYPTFDGSSTFKSINWSSIGLVDPLNCFWTKLWVSYSSNNAIQNHLNCFIKHFHVSQVWFYPPIPNQNPIKTQFSKYKKEFAENIPKIIRNIFTKSHEIVLIYNPIKSYF